MSESLDQILMKYYSGKLRALREMAIYKMKSELFSKELQCTKQSLKKEKEEKNNLMKEMQNLIKIENEELYKKIIDETKIETNSIKNEIETLKENNNDKINSLESKIDSLNQEMVNLIEKMDELNRPRDTNSEENREEGPIDKDGTEDIWQAASRGSLAGVKYYFTQNPLNLNKTKGVLNSTPLHYASVTGHLEVVKYLISKLAQVDPKDISNTTPLMLACGWGHTPIVNLLLDKGAEINHLNTDRYTPLHYAIGGKHLDVVKLLIQRGADKTIKNNRGMTPLDLAASYKMRPIVNYLSSH